MVAMTAVPFMPHGHCYFWQPDVLLLNVVSDVLIAVAYFLIPLTLIFALRRLQSLPYRWIYIMFAAFIISCGLTHILDIITIWHPWYYLQGFIKAITAAISIATAILFIPLSRMVGRINSKEEKNPSQESGKDL